MPPFKISLLRSDEGNNKYGIVAESIRQVKDKAKQKFGLSSSPDELIIQLEDRTIIDDEDYFKCLEPSTCLLISEPRSKASDQVDGSLVAAGFLEAGADGHSMLPIPETMELPNLAARLHQDISNIGLFSDRQLEMIANAGPQELSNCLHLTNDEADSLQEACHAHLVEREKTTDAINLLEMFKKSPSTDQTDSRKSSRKKRRLSK